jgi:ABC-type arginine transport system permease subunit
MGINLDKNVAAIVALTLNTSAFNAEIWRNAFRTFPARTAGAAESGDAPLDLFPLHHAAADVDRKPAGAGQ